MRGQGCAIPDQSNAGAFLCAGGGFNRITLSKDPSDGFANVVINYEYSEYEFGDETPIRLEGTSFFRGTGSNYTAANSQVSIQTAGPGTIVPSINIMGATTSEYIVVNFAYHVQDTKTNLVTLASATAGERMLTMKETLAASNVFQTSLALFSQGDYQAISSEAGNAGNDSGTADGEDIVITIDEMLDGLGTRMVTTGSGDDEVMSLMYPAELKVRVERAITALEFIRAPKTQADTPASELVDRLLQVAHGDTLTFAYTDASPAATAVKTATVDLEAPVVTLIGPVDRLFSNSTAHQLNVDVVGTTSGVESDDIMLVASGMSLGADTAKAPIVNGFRVTNVPSILTEGEKEWFVTVRDKVGNTPAKNDKATKGINEAPRGAAPPLTATPRTTPSRSLWTPAPRLSPGQDWNVPDECRRYHGRRDRPGRRRLHNRSGCESSSILAQAGLRWTPRQYRWATSGWPAPEPLAAIVNANPQGDIDKAGRFTCRCRSRRQTPSPRWTWWVRLATGRAISAQRAQSLLSMTAWPRLSPTPRREIVKDEMTITLPPVRGLASILW